jgi:AraC-like DNA-binding protein
MVQALPVSSFDTAPLPAKEQFPAWRESIAPMFDAASLGECDPAAFQGAFRTYFAGPLILGGTAFDGHRYGRDDGRVRRDGLNHYHIGLQVSGRIVGRLGEHDIVIGPGDIVLLDFARQVALQAERCEMLVIGVPREAIELNIPPGEHHGLVLRGETGLGSLLGDHMRSLIARLPAMTAEEATAAAAGSVGMIAACFQPTAATFARAQPALLESLLSRIRRHIALNLRAGPVGADEICNEFHISRASLYRLFEPFGGVASYVQNQRLSHVFTALMNPLQNHRNISEIAYDWGFTSESHFSRAFRKAFGMTPRDARSAMQDGAPIGPALREWLPMIRRA